MTGAKSRGVGVGDWHSVGSNLAKKNGDFMFSKNALPWALEIISKQTAILYFIQYAQPPMNPCFPAPVSICALLNDDPCCASVLRPGCSLGPTQPVSPSSPL
jgi:hypothetical protein